MKFNLRVSEFSDENKGDTFAGPEELLKRMLLRSRVTVEVDIEEWKKVVSYELSPEMRQILNRFGGQWVSSKTVEPE